MLGVTKFCRHIHKFRRQISIGSNNSTKTCFIYRQFFVRKLPKANVIRQIRKIFCSESLNSVGKFSNSTGKFTNSVGKFRSANLYNNSIRKTCSIYLQFSARKLLSANALRQIRKTLCSVSLNFVGKFTNSVGKFRSGIN